MLKEIHSKSKNAFHMNPQTHYFILMCQVKDVAFRLASKGMFLTKPLSYPGYVSRIDLGSMGLIHFLDSLTLRGKEHVEDGSPAYHSWGGQAKVKSRRFPCFAPQPRLP